MSTQELYPDRFDCSDDEGPDDNNLDQDGNPPEVVPKEHSPYGLTTDSMILTDHSRASVHVYVREDLKRSQRVKFDTFVEAVLGITPQTMTEWMSIIAREKWHEDEAVSARLSAFCAATREAARYEPLSDLVNRIMQMAHGRLPGVPEEYPIADICVRKNDPLYIRPIEAHRGLGAKRKPDLLTLRGRHAVNLPPFRTGNSSPPPKAPSPPKTDQQPRTESTQQDSSLPTTTKLRPQRKGRAPRRGASKKTAASSHRSDVAPASDVVADSCNLDTNGSDIATADRPGGLACDPGTVLPATSHGDSTASSSTHGAASQQQSSAGKKVTAKGVRWVDDIMNWELKGTADLEPLLTAFVEDRKRAVPPATAAAGSGTTHIAPPSPSVACSTEDSDRDLSDSDSDYDDSVSVGTKRRRKSHDVLESVRLPEPHVNPSMMDSEEREPFDLREAAIQTGSYALETLACTFGTRLFCVNIMMQNDRLHLWYYDACGFVCTDSISLVDDFERTAALFVGVACATPAQLGALPSVIKPPRRAPYPENWPPENLKGHTLKVPQTILGPDGNVAHTKDIHLTLQDSVFTQYILAGRRTFVYTVRTRPQLSKGNLIAKLSYQVTTRWEEHQLIDKAAAAGVSHLPTAHAWGDLWKMSDGVRGIFYTKEKTEFEDRTLRVIIYDKYLPLETLFSSSPESIPLMAYQMIDCECNTSPFLPILTAVMSSGLHDLRYKAKILHRDISVNNVMYEHRDGRLNFILIDFDMATVVSDDPNESHDRRSKHRTGTLAFMAIALIEDAANALQFPGHESIPHLLCHDFESIFWLCLWCTLVMVAVDSQAQRESFLAVVRAWEMEDLWTIASLKGNIKGSELYVKGIRLSQAAINAGLDGWFRKWGRMWNSCVSYINDYDFKYMNAKRRGKPLPVMDWETVNGLITRDTLKKHLTACIPDPYASPIDIDEPPVNPATMEEAISANVTNVPNDTTVVNAAPEVLETTSIPNVATATADTSAMAANDTSGDRFPAEVDLAAATRATHNIDDHKAAAGTGERRMKTHASTRLAAAKAVSLAARKVVTRPGRAKPVARRARSPTREQSVEIVRKANAAAKRTAKKADAAAKKTTKKTSTAEKKVTKKTTVPEKKATKKTIAGNRRATKQMGPVEKAAKRIIATTTDGEAENDIRKRLRPRK
ncbi:hypothetical protein NM688_g5202 [Phlebia brevispora]|uniref:Uncharacterized protein n=1 Tax=Phlebia brevispora TaxID=194682 RepID=A0ACC1SZJ9_9APHY|nr:hypothetical protein NM688_g5202 [Phlebia brevispora]